MFYIWNISACIAHILHLEYFTSWWLWRLWWWLCNITV